EHARIELRVVHVDATFVTLDDVSEEAVPAVPGNGETCGGAADLNQTNTILADHKACGFRVDRDVVFLSSFAHPVEELLRGCEVIDEEELNVIRQHRCQLPVRTAAAGRRIGQGDATQPHRQ